jgi:hypothetical protein
VSEFTDAVRELLQTFLDGEERLLVLNPSRLEVSRMEGRPFSGCANLLLRLTMVEITHIIAERVLSLVDDKFTDRARVCLVLEEAHSLVPEWNSAVHEGERSAVNGTVARFSKAASMGSDACSSPNEPPTSRRASSINATRSLRFAHMTRPGWGSCRTTSAPLTHSCSLPYPSATLSSSGVHHRATRRSSSSSTTRPRSGPTSGSSASGTSPVTQPPSDDDDVPF